MLLLSKQNGIKCLTASLAIGTEYLNLADARIDNLTLSVLPNSVASVVVNFSTSSPDVVNNNPGSIVWQPWPLGTITPSSSKKSDTYVGVITALQFVVSGATANIEVTA